MEKPREHCCDEMARQANYACDLHPDRFDCPDCLIHPTDHGGYGIIIHDGGTSFSVINYCPWCGADVRVS